jgi:hypothetical protein
MGIVEGKVKDGFTTKDAKTRRRDFLNVFHVGPAGSQSGRDVGSLLMRSPGSAPAMFPASKTVGLQDKKSKTFVSSRPSW